MASTLDPGAALTGIAVVEGIRLDVAESHQAGGPRVNFAEQRVELAECHLRARHLEVVRHERRLDRAAFSGLTWAPNPA